MAEAESGGPLCPEIHRQRLIVEGLFGVPLVDEPFVRCLLGDLTRAMGMTPIADALIFSPDRVSRLHHGVGGFQPWAESGCSLYTWRDQGFFTLELYSCKAFDERDVVAFLETHLQARAVRVRGLTGPA